MNLESIQFLTLAAGVIALTAFLMVPAATMAMSKVPAGTATKSTNSSEGAACDLPPYVEIDESKTNSPMRGTPPLDRQVTENYSTATFAMG